MEQVDTLLNGRKLIQDTERFMFGIDAVLLSYFATSQIRNQDKVCDLGTGTGIIPFLLETSTKASFLEGLEVQEESAKMAEKSVKMNNLESKIKIVNGDIKNVENLFARHSFDAVTTNPPYMIFEHGKQNPSDAKAIARHEVLCNLEQIISAADYLLKPHGKFFMIHRPFRLPEIFTSMTKHGIEPKRMQLICPFEGKEANMVLIEGRKNARPRLELEPNLNVYRVAGDYSEEVKKIYQSFVLGE